MLGNSPGERGYFHGFLEYLRAASQIDMGDDISVDRIADAIQSRLSLRLQANVLRDQYHNGGTGEGSWFATLRQIRDDYQSIQSRGDDLVEAYASLLVQQVMIARVMLRRQHCGIGDYTYQAIFDTIAAVETERRIGSKHAAFSAMATTIMPLMAGEIIEWIEN